MAQHLDLFLGTENTVAAYGIQSGGREKAFGKERRLCWLPSFLYCTWFSKVFQVLWAKSKANSSELREAKWHTLKTHHSTLGASERSIVGNICLHTFALLKMNLAYRLPLWPVGRPHVVRIQLRYCRRRNMTNGQKTGVFSGGLGWELRIMSSPSWVL